MTSWTVNCSILLADRPLLARPQAARDAGFDAVEFWWPFPTATPSDREVDEFVAAVRDAGVTLSGLNFAAGDMPAGERGLLSDPKRAEQFRDSVAIAVEIGAHLGTAGFNALYGLRLDAGTLLAPSDPRLALLHQIAEGVRSLLRTAQQTYPITRMPGRKVSA